MRHLPPLPYLFGLVIFFVGVFSVGIGLTFWANGYRLLTRPIRIVKTGVISLETHPTQGVNIYLNRELQPSGQTDFTALAPGRYAIRVEQPDFWPWETSVELDAGQAIRLEDIVLFYTDPLIETVTNSDLLGSYQTVLRKPEHFEYGLQILETELWAYDHFVTRYSLPIRQAVWLPDETHLLVLIASDLHILDLDGQNDRVLYTFPLDAQTIRFAPLAGGQKVLIEIDGTYLVLTITQPYSLLPFNLVNLPKIGYDKPTN